MTQIYEIVGNKLVSRDVTIQDIEQANSRVKEWEKLELDMFNSREIFYARCNQFPVKKQLN